jgi:hypothetical protein
MRVTVMTQLELLGLRESQPLGPFLDCLRAMPDRLGRLGEAPVERVKNLVVTGEDAAVIEHERRDAPPAGRALQFHALGRVDGNLVSYEVEAELR